MRKFLLNLLLLLGSVGIAGAQTISVSHLSAAETPSPLIAGSSNNVVFAFTVSKTGGGATNLTSFFVGTGATDPNSVFSSVQLFSSATTLGAGSNTNATVALNTNDITFTGNPSNIFAFGGGAETRNFYLVATVKPGVPTTLAGIPSVTFTLYDANTTFSAGTENVFSVVRTNMEFEALNAEFTQATGGVPASLSAGSNNQAIIGFRVETNGTQSLESVKFDFSTINPQTGSLSGFQIVNNGASATYSGGAPLGATPSTLNGTTVEFTNLGQSISGSGTYFFLIADVAPAAGAQNFSVELDAATADVGATSGLTFTQGPTAIASLTTTFASITGGVATSPLIEGTQDQAILGFSATSNGSATITAIEFPISPTVTDLDDYFSSIKLYESTNATFGGADVEITDPSGYSVDLSNTDKIVITNLSQTITTTTRYYFVVADIANDISAIRGNKLQLELTSADITMDGTASVPAAITSANFKFLYAMSSVVTVSDDGQSSLDSTDYVYQGALNNSGMGERVFAIQVADSDPDMRATKVTSLTFEFEDHHNLDSVALFVNGTTAPLVRAKVSDVISANQITFNLTPPNADAGDNGNRTYTLNVSFQPNVTDGDRITVELKDAVADTTQGSGIAPFGTIKTNATDNDITVIAGRLVIDPSIVSTIAPGATFTATVSAQDFHGNIDKDFSQTVGIFASGGSGTLTGGALKAGSAGVYTFNTLAIDAAGTYTLTASDDPAGDDLFTDTTPITVNSPGVLITNGYTGGVFNRDICFGLKTYDSLGTIKFQEQDRGDFASGGYYMFELPPGFIFNTAKAPTITETGNEVTIVSLGATANHYVGSNIFRFRYNITGTTDVVKDAITIKGLEVMPDSTYTGTAGGDVTVLDAGAVMVGNAEVNAMSHGTINLTNPSAAAFDFEVAAFPGQTPVVPEETQFSYTVFGVILKPSPSNPASSYPVFQGNGVSRSNTQNAYVFSPSSVGVGNNYNISFTTRVTSTGCKVTRTKVFTVYATSISGLLTEYCENDDNTKSLSVPKDRYSPAKYYANWDASAFYIAGSRVNYNGDAFQCVTPTTIAHEPPTNPTYWKEFGYTFTNEYSISIPSNKTISAVNNNGSGTITITSPNHGFTAGSKLYLGYYVYDANWNVVFSIPYPTGDESTYYTIANVTTNTFTISYLNPAAGVYSGGYGYIYIQNPQVTGVTFLNNVVTATVPNHGLSTGATVRIYLQGLSGNGVSNVINDWYTINKIDNNTFSFTTAVNVSGVWSGYGFVDIFSYKITSFRPSMASTLNSKFGTVTDIYVGFFVKSIGCVENTSNTCSSLIYSQEPVKLNQLAEVDFEGLNATGEYCANSTIVTLTGNQVDGSFSGPGVTDGGANNNGGTFTPSPALEGTKFVITYTFTDNKNCTASIADSVRVNETPDPPTATPASFGYCVGDTQPLYIKTSGTGNEFAWYNNASKTTFLGNGPVYDASSEGTGSPKTVSFFATQFSDGCESATQKIDLIINQPPDADITNIGQCAGDTITFKGSRTNIATWDWDFGDGSVHGTDSTVTHIFDESRTFTVKLLVKSTTLPGNTTCTNSSFINLFVGFNPTIDVKYQRICDGDNTLFAHTSSPPLDNISWNFGDATPILSGDATQATYKHPGHVYAAPGTYNVTIVGTTSIGCVDTVRKVVPILVKLAPTSGAPYLMKTAMPGNESGYWQIETTVDSTSTWEFNVPAGTSMQWADSAWVTGASTAYKPNDVSYVNSPCFDITGFARPLISLNYMHDVQNGRDGAIIEYSTNSGVTWTKLGTPETGLEWYNVPNPINALGNVFGWTGRDTTVQAGFHSLSGIPMADRDNVRFRIKFASDQDTESEGFAFNNVNIVEKNRLILVENFTNNSKPETVNHNTIYRNLGTYLSPTEFVPLEYHIVPAGFGADPVNELNKADNNARAAFYGITQNVTSTQDGILMGTFNAIPAATNLKPAFEDEFNLRSLRSSPISLDIVTSNVANGQYKIDVTVTALENIDTDEPIALYIALVEKVLDDPSLTGDNGETQYRYVLRKMLPSAVGKRLAFPMAVGVPATFSETITITDQMFSDISEMAVVAFVQNQNIDRDGRKDVWQAQLEDTPISPAIITDIEPTFGDLVSIYPVPARGKLNIELVEKPKRAMPVNLVDNFGREVYVNQFRTGERLKTIETKELASGVYILQILSDKGELLRRKVVITND
ncbi:PKD domain-containing protein [Pseudochryseolinea flava]|uniref:PKD domain-containing protein n=1 Tax=Pseudochryseolinea flava TaxID=2059302 RepID=A0A364XYW0_9BACT|nr:PKD domain-containing protein [Pseudochryseolinea flava]RAV99179.1 hypothetical protein DQQ10_19970 [Pseudochryseolinea flava]